MTNRAAISSVALGLSFLAKFFPILVLLTLVKRVRLGYLAIFALVVFAFYLPFLGAGLHLLDGLANYSRDWLNNASLFHLFHFVVRSKAGAEVVAGSMVMATMAYLAKRKADPLWSSLILTGGVLLVSPTAYPWYFTWSIPFLCFYPTPAWLLMSITTILAYTPAIAFAEGIKASFLMSSLEYGPVYLWLAYSCWDARRTIISPGAQ
jgi:alpha-1,6-mannosyltransferase